MQIDYELTERDFIDSFAAHRNRKTLSKWMTRLFLSLILVFAAILAFGLIVKPNAQDAKNLMPFFVLTFLWIGILLVLPRWNARRQFLKQPGAHRDRALC